MSAFKSNFRAGGLMALIAAAIAFQSVRTSPEEAPDRRRSRGKGKTKLHTRGGTKRYQRAAAKIRRVKAHRGRA